MANNNDDRLLEKARETLLQYLKANKMRRTPERFAILEKVFSTGAHFYADVLHEALVLEGFRVSLSTVYSTIQLLVDAGLVRRHQFGNQPAQYERVEITSNETNHLHLVCNDCGRVRAVKDPDLMARISAMKFRTFTGEYCTLYVYGLCSRCKKRRQGGR